MFHVYMVLGNLNQGENVHCKVSIPGQTYDPFLSFLCQIWNVSLYRFGLVGPSAHIFPLKLTYLT